MTEQPIEEPPQTGDGQDDGDTPKPDLDPDYGTDDDGE